MNIVWTRRVVGTVVFCSLLGGTPLWAQDHRDVVERVRRELTARGVIPAGIVNLNNTNPCGVHQITRRVAWELRGEGWGLLEKSSGNHCEWKGQRYSMDFVVTPDGRSVDIAVGGEFDGVTTDAAPSWHIEQIDGHIGRWRPAQEPEDMPAPPPVVVPPPAPAPVPPPVVLPPPVITYPPPVTCLECSEILTIVRETREDVKVIRSGMDRAWRFIAKYIVPPVIAVITTWQVKPENKDQP